MTITLTFPWIVGIGFVIGAVVITYWFMKDSTGDPFDFTPLGCAVVVLLWTVAALLTLAIHFALT